MRVAIRVPYNCASDGPLSPNVLCRTVVPRTWIFASSDLRQPTASSDSKRSSQSSEKFGERNKAIMMYSVEI